MQVNEATKNASEYSKTKELVIYLSRRLGDRPDYDATLLGKALYFVDSVHYFHTRKPISELTYIWKGNAAAPNPTIFHQVEIILKAAGDADITGGKGYKKQDRKLIARRDANLRLFLSEEITRVNEVLNDIDKWSKPEIENVFYHPLAFDVARENEELPFFTFFIRTVTPTPGDIERAKAEFATCIK